MTLPKATIIGAKGFIGRHLAAKLLSDRWDCHLPDKNWRYDGKDSMGHVFYCAGLTADYLQRPFATVDAHVSSLSRILQTDHFDSLVYLSSTRLYDSQPGIEATEDLSLVLDPLNPRHIFDLSKGLGESLCSLTGQGRARVARLSCIYNDHTDEDGFLPGLLKEIIVNQPSFLEVDSSPFFSRDYLHLDDVLKALILIAQRGTSTIYNVASGENVTNKYLFEGLSQASGCEISALRQDVPISPSPAINIQKMQKEFGWRPEPVLQKVCSIIERNRL